MLEAGRKQYVQQRSKQSNNPKNRQDKNRHTDNDNDDNDDDNDTRQRRHTQAQQCARLPGPNHAPPGSSQCPPHTWPLNQAYSTTRSHPAFKSCTAALPIFSDHIPLSKPYKAALRPEPLTLDFLVPNRMVANLQWIVPRNSKRCFAFCPRGSNKCISLIVCSFIQPCC